MSTITQRTQNVVVHTGESEKTVNVRRLPWKASSAFIDGIGKLITEVINKEELSVADILAKLPSVLPKSQELVMLLITNCTPLGPDEINEMDACDVLELVKVAVEINLDDKTKNSFAGITDFVRAFMTPTN